jgi:hypothetical protein
VAAYVYYQNSILLQSEIVPVAVNEKHELSKSKLYNFVPVAPVVTPVKIEPMHTIQERVQDYQKADAMFNFMNPQS